MKIRNGFVSNSSSSSFIIDGNKYTCVDIAKKMANVLQTENNWSHFETVCNNLDKLENKNTPIYIEMSDDLVIFKHEENIYVSASHHYCWNLDTIERGDEGEYSELYEDLYFYFPVYNNKYLGKYIYSFEINEIYPDIDIYNHTCKCGKKTFIKLKSGEICCPNCNRMPDGKHISIVQREEKLNRVIKQK